MPVRFIRKYGSSWGTNRKGEKLGWMGWCEGKGFGSSTSWKGWWRKFGLCDFKRRRGGRGVGVGLGWGKQCCSPKQVLLQMMMFIRETSYQNRNSNDRNLKTWAICFKQKTTCRVWKSYPGMFRFQLNFSLLGWRWSLNHWTTGAGMVAVARRWKPPHKEKKTMASPPCVGKGAPKRRVKGEGFHSCTPTRQEDDDPQTNGLKAKPTQEKCVVSGKNFPDFAQIKCPEI